MALAPVPRRPAHFPGLGGFGGAFKPVPGLAMLGEMTGGGFLCELPILEMRFFFT